MTDEIAADTPKRFVIVDDHPLFREALRSALRASFNGAQVQETDSIDAACDALGAESDIDLILLDLALQRFDGFEGLTRLRKQFPFIPVLIVSGLEEPRLIHEALCLGASGFVPKALGRAALAEAISTVLSGKIYAPNRSADPRLRPARPRAELIVANGLASLTPAQARVLTLVRRGLLNKEIAAELDIGESTVKAHVSEIIRKLGVISRTQIVIEAARHDLVAAQTGRDLS